MVKCLGNLFPLIPSCQKVDSAISRINFNPVDDEVGFPCTYSLMCNNRGLLDQLWNFLESVQGDNQLQLFPYFDTNTLRLFCCRHSYLFITGNV